MNSILQKHHRLLFYGCWVLLGLIQSAFTELQDDEAYYWVYGKYLDWGYFDHPPMIGLLVKIGYSIFPNELGVRLLPLLLNVFSLLIIEKLLTNKNNFLFYIIALSIAVLQVSGFIAVPDIPLIFFTALFFLCYQEFLAKASIVNIFLLGLSMALLCYSKYHAVLVIFFVLLSNIKLLARWPIYLAGVFALLLFAPHLWWQYQHDWVSFRYHLFESNVNAYRFSFTTEYLIGQLLLPGPIAGFILLPAAFLYKSRSVTEKAMKFVLIGLYVFFLLSSFRGQVEANWTSPALVPLFVLSHQFISQKYSWQKILVRLFPLTMLLVVAAWLAMIVDFVPLNAIRERYHSWKKWPAEMREKTGGLPIVFSNSYQRASKYWFYSGQMTYSQNHYRERKNNYNFWPVEDSLLGKPVYFLDKYDLFRFPDSLNTPIGWVGYRYDSAFLSFAKIQFVAAVSPNTAGSDSLPLTLSCSIPENYKSFIQTHPFDDTIRVGVFNNRGWIKDIPTNLRLRQLINSPSATLTLKTGLPPGDYYLRIAIHCGNNNPTHNSEKIRVGGLTP